VSAQRQTKCEPSEIDPRNERWDIVGGHGFRTPTVAVGSERRRGVRTYSGDYQHSANAARRQFAHAVDRDDRRRPDSLSARPLFEGRNSGRPSQRHGAVRFRGRRAEHLGRFADWSAAPEPDRHEHIPFAWLAERRFRNYLPGPRWISLGGKHESLQNRSAARRI